MDVLLQLLQRLDQFQCATPLAVDRNRKIRILISFIPISFDLDGCDFSLDGPRHFFQAHFGRAICFIRCLQPNPTKFDTVFGVIDTFYQLNCFCLPILLPGMADHAGQNPSHEHRVVLHIYIHLEDFTAERQISINRQHQ